MIDGGGTVPPELGVARRLVDRGHRVIVLADETLTDQVRSVTEDFIPFSVSWGQFQDWRLRTPTSLLRGMVGQLFVGPAPTQARDTAAAIDRFRPDLVVASFSAVGCMIAAESRGIPFDVLLPNVYALPVEGMPPFGAGLKPAVGPLGRVRDRLATGASTALFDRYALAPINDLRATHGLDAITHSWDQLHHARRELVLTAAAFDFPAKLPQNVRYVGPILDDPTWAADDGWTLPPGNERLVLVALSSTFQDQSECIQRIADALGGLPVRGLVTTGPAIRADAIRAPKNVTVVASAPHREVLPQCDAIVTHGGHGTVMKALAAGVPLVILPHGRDQADNATRVVERGAGVTVSRRARAERIARKIAEVLDHDTYRRAAAKLGLTISTTAAAPTLIDELESIRKSD
ncbi:glycosyltransferase [Glaciihabitans tibetensis]|uniref:glycosyltransferase n=1 Tax=Glaciihabitans tibetensis TaxID=1266600 RepID=UPI0015E6B5F3|nr:glycosyltransferase [Glaciihabitans tibetensis]